MPSSQTTKSGAPSAKIIIDFSEFRARPDYWRFRAERSIAIDRTGSMYIPNTGAGDVYQFVAMDDIWLDAGRHIIRLVVDGTGPSKGNLDYFTINQYFSPQFCDPEWWEIQECQNGGGSWDYAICGCTYGWLEWQCQVY